MRNIFYNCDICADEQDETKLIGFEWCGIDGSYDEVIKKMYPSATEHHICKRCAKQLREFLKDLTEIV